MPETRKPTGVLTIDGATYTVDNVGNRLSRADLQASITTSYGYDSIYQLIGNQGTDGAFPDIVR